MTTVKTNLDVPAAGRAPFTPSADLPRSDVQAAIEYLLTQIQPIDGDLAAIAALTTTAYGRALLELADAAAGRTALALGTMATETAANYLTTAAAAAGYQQLDSDLTAIAALTTTAYGRALLELADAAAGRTALALGTMATETAANYLTTAAVAAGYQQLDSDLTAIAALTTTAYGRALLELADAAAGRSALSLATSTTVGRLARYTGTTGATGQTTGLYEDGSGNVGIGTTSPGAKLDVIGQSWVRSSAAGRALKMYEDGTNFRMVIEGDASGFGLTYKAANGGGNHKFEVAGTEKVIIDSTGVGIGTTSPSALLDVNSNTKRLRSTRTPASATAAGNQGDWCYDTNYIYVCTATNTWKRAALATW